MKKIDKHTNYKSMYFAKRILSFVLSLVLLSAVTVPTYAVGEPSAKEEVIYVNLSADGTVEEVLAVNIFEGGDITDYGDYSSVELLNTTDKIAKTGDMITFSTSADRVYYKGKLNSTVIPWDISVKYYIDGTEYTPDEVAGKSGALKISFKITKNEEYNGTFFDAYALQASLTLDTENCSDITAEGATVANVGSDKQLTYTILPGCGIDVEITADVTDFEMSAISINALKMGLEIEIDDGSIQNKIDEIIGAVNDLDEGAEKLNEGAGEISEGTALLNDKVGELYSGVGSLNDGATELSGGLWTIVSKNEELLGGGYTAFTGLCTASQTILNAELTKNGMQTVTLTPETYATVLEGLIANMDADSVYNTAYSKALAKVTAEVESKAADLYAGYVDTNADSIYLTYMQSQASELNAQVASQAVLEQLISGGYTQAQATAYLKTAEGKALITKTVNAMTDAQKQMIIATAVGNLTAEQKTQIKAGAVKSLTADQKEQIKNGYIEQTMKSGEVTSQITSAVNAANAAAASIAELKGQLDNYSLFYEGLKSYTSAVSNAANGAYTLQINMDTLCENVGTLKTAVAELNDGASELYDGTAELKDGTGEFAQKTSGMDTVVSDEINSMISSVSGESTEITSFVSEKNTDVDAVQFVIKTEAIEIDEVETVVPEAPQKLTFWQKILRLFGLY